MKASKLEEYYSQLYSIFNKMDGSLLSSAIISTCFNVDDNTVESISSFGIDQYCNDVYASRTAKHRTMLFIRRPSTPVFIFLELQ